VNFALLTRRYVRLAVMAMASCLFICPAGWAAQYAKGKLIPELQLKNGTVLHDVTVVAVGSTTVVAKWDGGKGAIPLAQLPAEVRNDLAPAAPPVSPATAPASPAIDPAAASAELPTDIKLTNGFVMHRSTIKRWDTNSVLVSYPGGVVSVRFSNMVPEQRVIFEARKDEALARQSKEDANVATSDDTAAHEEEARRAKEAQERDVADKKAEEIRNGISFHYLVKGMSKQDVKQAYGRPVDDHGDVFLYPSRGSDKYGNSADRSLTFQDGQLTGWRDQREGDPDGAVQH